MIEKLKDLFKSFQECYGNYIIKNSGEVNKKGIKITGKAYTIRKHLTDDLQNIIWKKHLLGEEGLGLAPILVDSTSYWGAIDIDDYNLNHLELIQKITALQLPLIPIASKSGGLHLYLFLEEATTALKIREVLQEYAAALGYSTAEIFPKQTKVFTEKGDAANWINMPYFNGYNKDQKQRYALNAKATALNLEEFIELAYLKRLNNISQACKVTLQVEDQFKDAPPCLFTVISKGKITTFRNEYLLAAAVFLKKKFTDWEDRAAQFAMKYLEPTLSNREVQSTISSLLKKDYFYKCNQAFLKNFCNIKKCRDTTYGVGGDYQDIKLIGLIKNCTEPPIWFVEIEGYGRIQCFTESLLNQYNFQKVCMEQINKVIPKVKANIWEDKISTLFEKMTIVEMPEEATPRGEFMMLLSDYLTKNVQARELSEIALGRPFIQEQHFLFTSAGLFNFLTRQAFDLKVFSKSKIMVVMKDLGVESIRVPLIIQNKRTQLRVWKLALSVVDKCDIIRKTEHPDEVF
jgi:hypothetical protein